MGFFKKISTVAAGIGLAVAIAGGAQASVSSLLTNGANAFDDLSGDFVLRRTGGTPTSPFTGFDLVTGTMATGDLIATVVSIENVNGTAVSSTGSELTGVVLQEITGITLIPALGTPTSGVVTLGPSTSAAADFLTIFGVDITVGPTAGLGTAPMLLLFEDTAGDLDLVLQDALTAIGNAADGSLVAAASVVGGTDGQAYTGETDLSAFPPLPGVSGGNFNFAYTVQFWGLSGTPISQMSGSGNILLPNTIFTGPGGFPFEDNFDGNVSLFLVPAPGTVGLLGLGLLGLGAASQRRRKA
ncbi:MAG: PEP-CTERM sorting domain-containing protein [Sphingomonadales bacterium]|nr:PEP-CTERM sorting domain-containing protein [Sphingomonadales bacterium]